MSNAIRISPPIKPLQRKKYNYFLPEVSSFLQNLSVSSRETASLVKHSLVCSTKTHTVTDQIAKLTALTRDDPLQDHDPPVSVELEPISNESQFDRVIAEAQQFEESVIVIWMASWCRKCIYLKPKLERLAAEYYPRIRFYCVDVNAVPHKLVARAGVTKMPTIQLWKDSEKQAEVIGGHKAYLVVNEVREMIENEYTL